MNCMGSGELVRILWVLFLGQLVSFLLASASFTSSLLSNLGVDAPLTQSFFTYCLLAVVYGGILLYRREKLKVSWYWYLGLAFADVQGNFLVIKAYQFSSITSVTLLDCWTIPWVLILTRIYIGTKYSLLHFLGAAVCIVGLVLAILSDASASTLGASNAILGDLLVVAGTLFYAISNVGEEFCTKRKDLVEVVGMLGVFGVLVNGCEILIFERSTLESLQWTSEIIILFAGFAVGSFLFYVVVPFVLKKGGSALFNLSLLTSDVWAVVIRLFFYREQIEWLYYVAFVVVAVGLVLYSTANKPSDSETRLTVQDEDESHQLLEPNGTGSDTVTI